MKSKANILRDAEKDMGPPGPKGNTRYIKILLEAGYNKAQVATHLGIGRTTLWRRLHPNYRVKEAAAREARVDLRKWNDPAVRAHFGIDKKTTPVDMSTGEATGGIVEEEVLKNLIISNGEGERNVGPVIQKQGREAREATST